MKKPIIDITENLTINNIFCIISNKILVIYSTKKFVAFERNTLRFGVSAFYLIGGDHEP